MYIYTHICTCIYIHIYAHMCKLYKGGWALLKGLKQHSVVFKQNAYQQHSHDVSPALRCSSRQAPYTYIYTYTYIYIHI